MKLFLDSAKTDEIRHGLDMWDIDGVTTNPRHIKESGKPFEQAIEEIAALFAGTDKPVSVEVDPHLTDWQQMVEQALHLASLSPNFVIKIGVSEGGFRAIRELTMQGVRTNATLVFSVPQAWHAARAGAYFISPFLGWREAHGDSAWELVPEIAAMLKNYGYTSQIIAAAIRNSRQIADAATAGAHCVTAGFAVYVDSFKNPYTTMGEGVFQQAWDETPKG
jgi:transaldolase